MWRVGYSPVAVHGLLIEVASLAVEQGLSCSAACEIFLDQGLNPYLLHWQVDFYPLYHQEVQVSFFFFNSLLTSTFFLSPVLLSFLWPLEAIKGLLQIQDGPKGCRISRHVRWF